MKVTDFKILLDSSAWLAYFLAVNKEIKGFIESEKTQLFTSVISLYEVKKKLIKEKYSRSKVNSVINFMKDSSIIIILNENIAEKAVEESIKHRLHTIDALIYSTAIENGAVLITGDLDFKDLKDVKILK